MTDNTSQVWYTLYVDGSPFVAEQIGHRTALLTHRFSPETSPPEAWLDWDQYSGRWITGDSLSAPPHASLM